MARMDPYQLRAKWQGQCANCGATIKRGQEAYYWPIGHKIKCIECGEPEYREFLAACADERSYNGW